MLPVFTLFDIQSDTGLLCAAFHVIVSSECRRFTLPDEFYDVQREDEGHQSTVEVTGNLIGELSTLTGGNVILPSQRLC